MSLADVVPERSGAERRGKLRNQCNRVRDADGFLDNVLRVFSNSLRRLQNCFGLRRKILLLRQRDGGFVSFFTFSSPVQPRSSS